MEQPPAPVLLLSSAVTDITTLANCLDGGSSPLGWPIRALPLSCLSHPAQIDHYLAETASQARLIVVRLLGGRGHWSYGLEQLQLWQKQLPGRTLLVLAGTGDQNDALHPLSSVSAPLCDLLAQLFREGGVANLRTVLTCLNSLLEAVSYTHLTLPTICSV